MREWLSQLKEALSQGLPATLVTVIRVKGSAPREVGARMIVLPNSQSGTIGGGNLEYKAVHHARDKMLSGSTPMERQVLSLGPGLGQCCGGSVELLYEVVTDRCEWLTEMSDKRQEWWCRCIDDNARYRSRFISSTDKPNDPAKLESTVHRLQGERLALVGHNDETWCCEPLFESVAQVWVFGAGHVGAAVVSQLALLPCQVLWIDERIEYLPERPPANTQTLCSDTPEAEVVHAPAGTSFVVMTHSHAADYEICRAVLARSDFFWFGLIGSATKRSTFERRLRLRGVDDGQLDRMRCPIGIDSIRSRKPASIAVSLAAELLSHWEASVRLIPETEKKRD